MKNKEVSKIYLKLDKISDAYSDYSTSEQVTIKEDFQQHIMNLADDKSIRNNVEINIHLATPASDDEKKSLIYAIKTHNKNLIRDTKNTQKRYLLLSALLLMASIVTALIYLHITEYVKSAIVEFFLEVGAWVFLWELVDILSFQLPSIWFKAYLNKRIIKSKINFIGETDCCNEEIPNDEKK